MSTNFEVIEANLLAILSEIEPQVEIGMTFPESVMKFEDQIVLWREFIIEAGEYGPAYESMVATLEQYPFQISGPTAIRLLELGLIFGFKTTMQKDMCFDIRT